MKAFISQPKRNKPSRYMNARYDMVRLARVLLLGKKSPGFSWSGAHSLGPRDGGGGLAR